MKTFRHFRHALALLLVSVLLAGCNALPGENLQVEELLRAPRLSGDYGAVQTALNDWLGESAQLKYPMQGELLSPFLLQDLDGDGQQDAAVLYTTAQSTNVCIAILQRDVGCTTRQNALHIDRDDFQGAVGLVVGVLLVTVLERAKVTEKLA